MKRHPICFASLGPGDPDLVTLKTLKALKAADTIIVPATTTADGTESSRAAAIITAHVPDAPIHTFRLPMSHDRQAAISAYDEVCLTALAAWGNGRRVVIAVEGDVSIYASIHYVMDALIAHGATVEQLPGIPSFIASAGAMQLSLVSGRERLVVLPGLDDQEALTQILQTGGVAVVMKLSGSARAVKHYVEGHDENRYDYIENTGHATEYHTSSRDDIISRPFPYFSLIIIRKKRSAGG